MPHVQGYGPVAPASCPLCDELLRLDGAVVVREELVDGLRGSLSWCTAHGARGRVKLAGSKFTGTRRACWSGCGTVRQGSGLPHPYRSSGCCHARCGSMILYYISIVIWALEVLPPTACCATVRLIAPTMTRSGVRVSQNYSCRSAPTGQQNLPHTSCSVLESILLGTHPLRSRYPAPIKLKQYNRINIGGPCLDRCIKKP